METELPKGLTTVSQASYTECSNCLLRRLGLQQVLHTVDLTAPCGYSLYCMGSPLSPALWLGACAAGCEREGKGCFRVSVSLPWVMSSASEASVLRVILTFMFVSSPSVPLAQGAP